MGSILTTASALHSGLVSSTRVFYCAVPAITFYCIYWIVRNVWQNFTSKTTIVMFVNIELYIKLAIITTIIIMLYSD